MSGLISESKDAEMVFADPPYNVAIEGHVSGLGKNRHREFVQASGETSNEAVFECRTILTATGGRCGHRSLMSLCPYDAVVSHTQRRTLAT